MKIGDTITIRIENGVYLPPIRFTGTIDKIVEDSLSNKVGIIHTKQGIIALTEDELHSMEVIFEKRKRKGEKKNGT